MSIAHQSYDVIVAGGGPAGAAAASLIAREGHRTLLLERSAEPRFKIGESLMPATYWTLERLGVLERMRQENFQVKHSVQFFTSKGRATSPFYFFENDEHESSQTWQVVRREFDQMLLDNAAEHCAEVHRGVAVKEILFEGDRAVGVRAEPAGGEAVNLDARVVVDATGQSAMLAKRFRLRRYEPRLKNAAVYTHFKGAQRDEGIDEGATLIFHTENQDSWFWYIPQPDDIVSVGVVGPIDYLIRSRQGDPQKIFQEELAICPALAPRLEGAEQAMPMKAIRDFSYRATEIAGDGWVMVGDAFGFIDPIYSTGVFLALKGAEMAADSVNAALAANDPSGARLGSFGPEFVAGMEAMRRLVYAYYDKNFSFADFLKQYPDCRKDLIHMLVGNVYREDVSRLLEALADHSEQPEEQPLLVASA